MSRVSERASEHTAKLPLPFFRSIVCTAWGARQAQASETASEQPARNFVGVRIIEDQLGAHF